MKIWRNDGQTAKAHLTECLNINDDEVLAQCAKDIGLDIDKWYSDYKNENTRELVLADLALARKYNVNSVPTLVANGKEKFIGAQSYESLELWFLSLKNKIMTENPKKNIGNLGEDIARQYLLKKDINYYTKYQMEAVRNRFNSTKR